MNEKLTIRIIEQPGKLGKLKASQLARLIATYAESHPEIGEAVKKKQEEPNGRKF